MPCRRSDHHALAWLNSMRLDLQTLGLERKADKVLDLLADIAEQAEAA